MIDLHIVTPCARPANLPLIAQSVRKASLPANLRLHWHIVLDKRFDIDATRVHPVVADMPNVRIETADASGVAGHFQRNHAIERIEKGWIVFVDDDNLLHPELPIGLAEAIQRHPDAGVIVFDQDLTGSSVRRAAPENVRAGRIDSAQLALERSFIGETRFNVYSYCADGLLVESLFHKAPERFAYWSKVLCIYNALNPGRWGELPPGRKTLGPLPAVHTAGSLHFHRSFSTDTHPGKPDLALVRFISNSDGDRILLTASGADDGFAVTVMRSPLNTGPQHLSGQATIVGGSEQAVQLDINLRDTSGDIANLAALKIEPGTQSRFSADINARESTELEFSCRIADGVTSSHGATVSIDKLIIESRPR